MRGRQKRSTRAAEPGDKMVNKKGKDDHCSCCHCCVFFLFWQDVKHVGTTGRYNTKTQKHMKTHSYSCTSGSFGKGWMYPAMPTVLNCQESRTVDCL